MFDRVALIVWAAALVVGAATGVWVERQYTQRRMVVRRCSCMRPVPPRPAQCPCRNEPMGATTTGDAW